MSDEEGRQPKNSRMREKLLIGLAYDVAERQLRDGSATSQVLVHFLKVGSRSEELSQEKLKSENELLKSKITALESQQQSESKYQEALDAMRRYSGVVDDEEFFD